MTTAGEITVDNSEIVFVIGIDLEISLGNMHLNIRDICLYKDCNSRL